MTILQNSLELAYFKTTVLTRHKLYIGIYKETKDFTCYKIKKYI